MVAGTQRDAEMLTCAFCGTYDSGSLGHSVIIRILTVSVSNLQGTGEHTALALSTSLPNKHVFGLYVAHCFSAVTKP